MATHSSIFAWSIPGTGEPGGLPSMELHRVGHNLSDLAGTAAAEGTGDPGLIPESERFPRKGNDNPLQYSCLENSMDRESWWAAIHWVTESEMTEYTHEETSLYNNA